MALHHNAPKKGAAEKCSMPPLIACLLNEAGAKCSAGFAWSEEVFLGPLKTAQMHPETVAQTYDGKNTL